MRDQINLYNENVQNMGLNAKKEKVQGSNLKFNKKLNLIFDFLASLSLQIRIKKFFKA